MKFMLIKNRMPSVLKAVLCLVGFLVLAGCNDENNRFVKDLERQRQEAHHRVQTAIIQGNLEVENLKQREANERSRLERNAKTEQARYSDTLKAETDRRRMDLDADTKRKIADMMEATKLKTALAQADMNAKIAEVNARTARLVAEGQAEVDKLQALEKTKTDAINASLFKALGVTSLIVGFLTILGLWIRQGHAYRVGEREKSVRFKFVIGSDNDLTDETRNSLLKMLAPPAASPPLITFKPKT